ncbi:MAG: hypothetical protein PHP59_04065 [Methanofollis sp.]|uniref:hypothetical protein n=1 Tax=Methanofollis sp. TaxID=2052835 RepID=UPI0026248E32|nr:hypothetical protein [Methanofollis sp.]MDD4254533.1 hypothetical protein [Methanofollis sp.]
METGIMWYPLLAIGILIFAAGCTTTPTDTSPPATIPLPAETVLTPRPAASSDLPNFDYAAVPLLSPGDTDWMTTNASYVTRTALRDETARAMYLGGGTIGGVLLSCHPTPFPSSGDGCALALRIANETVVVDFLVDEEKGRVVSTVTER